MMGLSLNLLLLKNLKMGHDVVMADQQELDILVNILKKWN